MRKRNVIFLFLILALMSLPISAQAYYYEYVYEWDFNVDAAHYEEHCTYITSGSKRCTVLNGSLNYYPAASVKFTDPLTLDTTHPEGQIVGFRIDIPLKQSYFFLAEPGYILFVNLFVFTDGMWESTPVGMITDDWVSYSVYLSSAWKGKQIDVYVKTYLVADGPDINPYFSIDYPRVYNYVKYIV